MMHSSVRVGVCFRDVGELIRKYSEKAICIPHSKKDTRAYGIYLEEDDGPYYVFIHEYLQTGFRDDFNVIIGIIGTGEERTEEIMREIGEKTGIITKPAHPLMKMKYDIFARAVDRLENLSKRVNKIYQKHQKDWRPG
jgi:hypothetical protein